ncbi:DUF61 family protein [Chloroflexota bacterium]
MKSALKLLSHWLNSRIALNYQDEIAIICRGKLEEKVIAKILDMPISTRRNRITIYKPQLALLRKPLKTTTQYLFSPKILE